MAIWEGLEINWPRTALGWLWFIPAVALFLTIVVYFIILAAPIVIVYYALRCLFRGRYTWRGPNW